MSTLAISGRCTITDALETRLADTVEVVHVKRPWQLPTASSRFVIANGFLAGKAIGAHEPYDADQTWQANFMGPVRAIDRILTANPAARICVLGSQSGYGGSFDQGYAGAKAALHLYVETTKLRSAGQQLVCVAPSIIEDSKMTRERTDHENLDNKRRAHPKQRFLRADEVAAMIFHLLYVDLGYTTGTTIRMHGGLRT